MVRVNARFQQGQLVLEQPLDLEEGTEVVVEVTPLENVEADEGDAWELACSRMETELNLADSSFDDWRKLYGFSDSDAS